MSESTTIKIPEIAYIVGEATLAAYLFDTRRIRIGGKKAPILNALASAGFFILLDYTRRAIASKYEEESLTYDRPLSVRSRVFQEDRAIPEKYKNSTALMQYPSVPVTSTMSTEQGIDAADQPVKVSIPSSYSQPKSYYPDESFQSYVRGETYNSNTGKRRSHK